MPFTEPNHAPARHPLAAHLPWPERQLLPGRRLALADTDGALAGLWVVLEVMLAAERARHNGGPEHELGERVMEGLSLALTDRAISRFQPE